MLNSSSLFGAVLLLAYSAVAAETPRTHAATETDETRKEAAASAARVNDCNLSLGHSLTMKRFNNGVKLTWAEEPGSVGYEVHRCDARWGPCTPSYLVTVYEPRYRDYLAWVSDHYWYRVIVLEAPCPVPEYFCKTAYGLCAGPAVCTQKPPSCPDVWIPVCGCDVQTYSNECYSDLAGVSVFWMGTCY